MKVTALYIYPFKGGPAVPVDEWKAEERGFEHDRRFMVTNPAGQFMTQRTHPALGRCSIELTDDEMLLRADGIGELRLSPSAASSELAGVQVWSDRVEARRTSTAADEFFSELVGEPAMLVYMGDAHRPVGTFPDHSLSFADGYPYLVLNTASLADLNTRIPGDPVPLLAFRPNIVIETNEPWAEDDWDELNFGDAVLRCTTNCERCSVTTLDPAFPDRPRKDQEPLRTLAKFRRNDSGGVDFARNAILSEPGIIRVGDQLA